jgi:hypothetical protein
MLAEREGRAPYTYFTIVSRLIIELMCCFCVSFPVLLGGVGWDGTVGRTASDILPALPLPELRGGFGAVTLTVLEQCL